MQLSEKAIDNIAEKRQQEQKTQNDIINGHRPSLNTPRKIYEKLSSLLNSVGLYGNVYNYFIELQKKMGF